MLKSNIIMVQHLSTRMHLIKSSRANEAKATCFRCIRTVPAKPDSFRLNVRIAVLVLVAEENTLDQKSAPDARNTLTLIS